MMTAKVHTRGIFRTKFPLEILTWYKSYNPTFKIRTEAGAIPSKGAK